MGILQNLLLEELNSKNALKLYNLAGCKKARKEGRKKERKKGREREEGRDRRGKRGRREEYNVI